MPIAAEWRSHSDPGRPTKKRHYSDKQRLKLISFELKQRPKIPP
jgi:hypothetical protein